jgi:hypothetical protein
MEWNVESIIEALVLSKYSTGFTELKSDLDVFRGIRNGLIHGMISEPTQRNTKKCIELALKMITFET